MAAQTKEHLAKTASILFQTKGFHGVGIAEVLKHAGVPKGSLYHHYPNGKSDLAIAAAEHSSSIMIEIIDQAFEDKNSYEDGVTTLFFKLAKLFEKMGVWNGCPISTTLFEGPENQPFRDKSNAIFTEWIAHLAAYGQHWGKTADTADRDATHLFFVLQGAWTLARSRKDADVLRNAPKMLVGP